MHADKRATFAKMLYELETLADLAYDSWMAQRRLEEFEAEATEATEAHRKNRTELTRDCTDRLNKHAALRVEANKLQAEVAVLAGPEIHGLVNATFQGVRNIWRIGKRHDFHVSRDELALAMHRHLMDAAEL